MDNDKKIGLLKNAIQLIVLLFAAFGGFLINIVPPGSEVKLPLGIAQFIALALLLYISAFSVYSLTLNKRRYKKNYRTWLLIAGLFLLLTVFSAFGYFNQYEKRVVKVENWGLTFVRGELSAESMDACKEDKINDNNRCEYELLTNYYTADQVVNGRLWTKESVQISKMQLLIWYIAFIITLSVTLFAAIELLSSGFKAKEPAS